MLLRVSKAVIEFFKARRRKTDPAQLSLFGDQTTVHQHQRRVGGKPTIVAEHRRKKRPAKVKVSKKLTRTPSASTPPETIPTPPAPSPQLKEATPPPEEVERHEKRDTFQIPAYLVERLEKDFEKLAKRAKKLGVEPPRFDIIDTVEEKDEKTGEVAVYKMVKVVGEAPKLPGWEFVAVLQHTAAGNIIRGVPTADVGPDELAAFRQRGPVCDHCKIRRQRNETFVVRDEKSGELKQCGRSCLKDFTGHKSPERVAAWVEVLAEFVDTRMRDAESEGYGADRLYEATDNFLANTIAIIRNEGWRSKKQAMESGSGGATANRALDNLHYARTPAQRHRMVEVTDADRKEAKEILAWAAKRLENPESDYEHNLAVAAKLGHVESSGILASLVPFYLREVAKAERLKVAKKLAVDSVHVGEVGKRQEFTLTLQRSFNFETQYGTMFIHNFTDPDGNIVIWKTNSPNIPSPDPESTPPFRDGMTYNVKASVKEHGEYKGAKQTVLTRMKIHVPKPKKMRKALFRVSRCPVV